MQELFYKNVKVGPILIRFYKDLEYLIKSFDQGN